MIRVVFRKWCDTGDIIALFPTVSADNTGQHCTSYAHIGQHGGADYTGVIARTRSAEPAEYAELLAELQYIGYSDLTIRARYTRAKEG